MSTLEISESRESQKAQPDSALSIADLGNIQSMMDSPQGDVRKFDWVPPPLPPLEINYGSIDNYDGDKSKETPQQQKIVAQAVSSLGKEMWHNWTPGRVPGGGATAALGCAASVSQILNDAKITKLVRSEDCNVDYMQEDLQKQGWTLTKNPQPGDVWIGRGGVSQAHTGIIGENFTMMNNHSKNGKFSTDVASYVKRWSNNVFLQPPDNKGQE